MHNCVTYLLKYDLKDAALSRLARIVHAADAEEDIDKDPIATGLEAIASGHSLCYPNNEASLTQQFKVYDALYARWRRQVAQNR